MDEIELKQDISGWDVRKVTDMRYMFANCWEFDQPIENWQLDSIRNIDGMFYNASKFSKDISSWNIDYNKVTFRLSNTVFGAKNMPKPDWLF
ncbi:MAG: BspA family leucine-rich repeat surface protein [Clostridia bacterium]|nr:BspA family leucine-rich repeat surface protein [Clostridia bacterium]